jgi:hypothetical protein
MSMAHLIVTDFGAIKSANIEIKKYNFFIGHTSSGKSTIAKLLAIFNNSIFLAIKEGDFSSFLRLLDKYNINFEFTSTTIIRYSNEKYYWEIGLNKFHSNYEDADLMEMANTSKSYDFILKFIERKENNFAYKEFIKSLRNLLDLKDSAMVELIKPALVGLLYEECIPVYIPAERLLISTFSNSIFSLLQAGASIPDCIKDFGSLYEKARIQYKNIDINILDIKVSFNNNGDTVYLMNENKEVKLSQTSSGIQSIIPLWIVFNQYVESKKKQILVIEEPELNLFPSTQHFLIDWIMRKMRESNGSIVITTHSPYVLSVVDNLILAQEILKKSNKKKLVLSKIKELIPSMALIDFDDVSSYFFHSDGNVKDIRDTDIKSLGAEYIDTASDKLGYIFDELCNIERNEL